MNIDNKTGQTSNARWMDKQETKKGDTMSKFGDTKIDGNEHAEADVWMRYMNRLAKFDPTCRLFLWQLELGFKPQPSFLTLRHDLRQGEHQKQLSKTSS